MTYVFILKMAENSTHSGNDYLITVKNNMSI